MRADRLRMPDEIGLGFMIDARKGRISTAAAPSSRRGPRSTLRHVLVGLEIEGNIPAEHAIVYHKRSQEVGAGQRRHVVADGQAQHRHRLAWRGPMAIPCVDDLWVEIYAMRELQYQKLMKRAKVVPRPFIKLDRRTANPPADF